MNVERLAVEQDVLYAGDTYALLVVFQALDAAGKDGTIKHVMSGVNPQGCEVHSFKAPSHEELDHDYLWRSAKRLPQRGRIGIFNRSYYEEVLVVRVHPELLAQQHLPPLGKNESIWKRRFEEINSFERYLVNNGISRPEVFLKRFEVGTEIPISQTDRREREELEIFGRRHSRTPILGRLHGGIRRDIQSDEHRLGALVHHSGGPQMVHAPMCLRDHRRYVKSLGLKYPKVSDQELAELQKAKEELLNEK